MSSTSQPMEAFAKGVRAQDTRAEIVKATVEVLSSHGVSGLTHRLVAARAGVSTAATTYHFDTKSSMIAEAAAFVVDRSCQALEEARDAHPNKRAQGGAFRQIAFQWLLTAAEQRRVETVAWAEVVLDAARHEENHAKSAAWFDRLTALWRAIGEETGIDNPAAMAVDAVDLVTGLMLTVVSLGLTAHQIKAVLFEDADPLSAWAVTADAMRQGRALGALERKGQKAAATREELLAAAIDILITHGPAALTYRAVAARSGRAAGAPVYYFPTVNSLLETAQAKLFSEKQQRSDVVMKIVERDEDLDAEKIADLLSVVLFRDATEFGNRNLAHYTIWLQGSRQPELRPMIWDAIEDRMRRWRILLARLTRNQRPSDALFGHSLLLGKVIRLLGTGASIRDLAIARAAIAEDLEAIVVGKYWAQTSAQS